MAENLKHSRKYGLGKEIGGTVSLHRRYEAVPGNMVLKAKHQLPEWHCTSQLRLLVGAPYPLSEAAEAHRRLESRHTHGKIVPIP